MDIIRADFEFFPVLVAFFVIINIIGSLMKKNKGQQIQGKSQADKRRAVKKSPSHPLIEPPSPTQPSIEPRNIYEEMRAALEKTIDGAQEQFRESKPEFVPKERVVEQVIERPPDEEALIRKTEYLPPEVTYPPKTKKKKRAPKAVTNFTNFDKNELKKALILYEILGPCKANKM